MAKNQGAAAGGDKDGELVDVVIARGTVDTGEETFTKGDTMRVTRAEARRFRALGTVLPEDYVLPAEVQDGSLKITAAAGVNVTLA